MVVLLVASKKEGFRMSNKKLVLSFTLFLLIGMTALFLSSCGATGGMMPDEASSDYYEESYAPTADSEMRAAEDGSPEMKQVNGEVGQSSLRYVIRNGSIDLTVQDTRETIKAVRDLIAGVDGIISYSYVYEIKEGIYGANLTLRVPQERFDSVMAQLEIMGKAANIQTGQDDVTMQYVDLESRLNNQKAQEARLVEILEMAKTVEEVLEVERELNRVRGEIESMTAQFRYLSDQVAYSTIDLSLKEEILPTQTITPGAFENIGERLLQAFVRGINFVLSAISSILIALIAILPLLVFLAVIVYLIWLLSRIISGKKKALAKKKAEEADK
jgi:hypothetical protein